MSRLRRCLCAFAWALLVPAATFGLTAGDIQGRAQQIAAERGRAQREAGADRALVPALGELVLAFVDLCDRDARAGAERRDVLRPAFEAVHTPLDDIYSARNAFLERKAKEVMDADGDLEALYETAPWREAQSVAAQALYYLNWLNYYGARLFDGERRTALLKAAQQGFSEFAGGDSRKDLVTESVLGRGLCSLELGNHDWAIRDFRNVLDEPTASAERKQKARLALLDAYGRGRKTKEALRYSQELLDGNTLDPADLPAVRFYRLSVLFDAMKATPAQADTYRREATALMDQLRKSGKGWADRVDALMISRVDNPAQWVGKVDSPAAKWELAALLIQRGDETAALPLLRDVAASDDPAARSRRGEANHYLGVMRFKAGDHAAALGYFDAALAEAKPEFAADAAYLRFKTLEALMASGGGEDLGTRYAAALREFLRQHPDHASAFEARYRLGEYLQAREEFADAIAEYEQVRGDPGFELRARFGLVQSEFERLKESLPPAEREQVVARIGEDLDSFWRQAAALEKGKDRGDLPLATFQAKATVMQAVLGSLRQTDGAEDTLKQLDGFERRYPEQGDLFPQVARLRLGALQRLSRFAEAEKEVERNAAVLNQDGRNEAIEKLAAGFVKAGARARASGDAAAGKAADAVALKLYELLGDEGSPDRKQKLTLARLYESNDEFDRAEAAYREVLQANSSSLPALRGLGRVAEQRKNLPAAIGYWKRFAEAARPGDPPWYEGRYEQARVTLAAGDRAGSCAILEDLKPAMPGLGDADLRRQLGELYKRACR